MSWENPEKPNPLEKISKVLDKSLSWFVALLLLAMSAIVFGNVISRYFLDFTLGWYEEVSRFLLIWIVFLGAVIALIRGDHLGIDVLFLFLPPRVCRFVVVLGDFLVLLALAVMFWGAWLMAMDSLASGWVASSIPIPYGWVYMVGPVSAALMFLQTIIKTIGDIRKIREAHP
jgi:TRAP-type C4-dicarboxylate transport system permease small subunit